MADDVREFSANSHPMPNEITAYRSREFVHAVRTNDAKTKVGGKNHDGPGYIVVENAQVNEDSKYKWMDEAEFNEKYAPATAADMVHRPQGPHFDAHEASKEQADGYQFDPNVKGDELAAAVLQNPQGNA